MRGLVFTLVLWIASVPAGADDPAVRSKETTSGPVTATVSLAPAAPSIGDTLTLTLRVVAKPQVEVLLPEFGEALERFPVRDFVPASEIDSEGRTVATQTYRLDAPRSGPLRIPPLLIEFVDRRPGNKPAPDGLDAYELLTEAIEFEVKSVLPENAAADLAPPLGELEAIERPSSTPWGWIAVGVLALASAGWFGGRAFAVWRRRARRESAYAIARKRLDQLLGAPLPNGEALDPFFVDLSGVVRRYLEDRYELRAPELTTEEFLEAVAKSPDLAAEHRPLLRDFLRRADLVKFAHYEPDEAQVRESIALAERFLEETRENAPLIEVESGEGTLAHG